MNSFLSNIFCFSGENYERKFVKRDIEFSRESIELRIARCIAIKGYLERIHVIGVSFKQIVSPHKRRIYLKRAFLTSLTASAKIDKLFIARESASTWWKNGRTSLVELREIHRWKLCKFFNFPARLELDWNTVFPIALITIIRRGSSDTLRCD